MPHLEDRAADLLHDRKASASVAVATPKASVDQIASSKWADLIKPEGYCGSTLRIKGR